MSPLALIVHGGAGLTTPDLGPLQEAGSRIAVTAGWQVLARGGTALDAVCAAVATFEDDPAFNAGVGSTLTSAGTVEMDASVMDGSDLRAGAAALVRTVRHPVLLARALMEDGRHVFLAGPETDAFADRSGLVRCSPDELVTDRQRQRFERHLRAHGEGTVGAAAMDRSGHVAAATSTGGLSCKSPGRIGDSAIIGAGTYADDSLGAASATGDGEAIMRVALAKRVVDSLGDGAEPSHAARRALRYLEQRVGGHGGIIVVDARGRVAHAYTTPHMTVAFMHEGLSAPLVSA